MIPELPRYLPAYEPPRQRRAALTAGLAPLVVLAVFTLIVVGALDVTLGLAVLMACTLWVVHEMSAFQRAVDVYNAEYVRRHLQWRPDECIAELMTDPATEPPARAFATRFLDSERMLLPDGQLN